MAVTLPLINAGPMDLMRMLAKMSNMVSFCALPKQVVSNPKVIRSVFFILTGEVQKYSIREKLINRSSSSKESVGILELGRSILSFGRHDIKDRPEFIQQQLV
jgi:hypothetical protein